MDFSSDANANFEGLLEVNREICVPQRTEKTSPDAPPNCAAVPYTLLLCLTKSTTSLTSQNAMQMTVSAPP